MVTKSKAKKAAPKKTVVAAKKSGAARKMAGPAGKAGMKYEQSGAPWWKRVPAPPPKSV